MALYKFTYLLIYLLITDVSTNNSNRDAWRHCRVRDSDGTSSDDCSTQSAAAAATAADRTACYTCSYLRRTQLTWLMAFPCYTVPPSVVVKFWVLKKVQKVQEIIKFVKSSKSSKF